MPSDLGMDSLKSIISTDSLSILKFDTRSMDDSVNLGWLGDIPPERVVPEKEALFMTKKIAALSYFERWFGRVFWSR